MTIRVDLNSDMGESFGAWPMGNDTAMLDIVTSANIACGFHAGDPDVMAQSMQQAATRGVAIGAHPGFADLRGFGRHRMDLPTHTLRHMIQYQLGAAMGMASAGGASVAHLKLHGALSNMASEDAELARICYQAALDIAPDIIIYVMSGTVMQTVVEELGCNWAGEVFADRAYNDDATLVDRRKPGAMIHDAAQAAARMREMVLSSAIITLAGKRLPARIDTICVHGDTPGALAIAQSVKQSLTDAGVVVAAPLAR